MKKLVCDQCGNHNDPGADVCALCHDPLDEEREAEKRRSAGAVLVQAIVMTVLCVVCPGLLLYGLVGLQAAMYGVYQPPVWGFLIGYAVLWGVALLFADRYSPRDDYDIGDRYGRRSINPFEAIQQERDENHIMLGCALMPVHLVLASWRQVAETRDQGKP